jgi:hypothetical protein
VDYGDNHTHPRDLLRDIHYKIMARRSTVRSGTFYLKDNVTTDTTTHVDSATDISSFVNVLEGEVLRVKQIWWEWETDGGGPVLGADVGTSKGCSAFASVSTQQRSTVGSLQNSSVLSINTLYAHSDSNTDIDMITNSTSVNPADFDDGFLVATDALYLNIDMSADSFAANIRANVMMECEIVKLSLSDAQAVLVSQTVG